MRNTMDGLEPMHENWTEGGQAGEGGDDDDDDDSGDPPRVWLKQKMTPGCAFTRSIGDGAGEEIGVYANPELVTKELREADQFVAIASDGVWEFLPSQQVVDMVTRATFLSPPRPRFTAPW